MLPSVLRCRAVLLMLLALCWTPTTLAQSSELLDEFERKVTTFTLDNGLTFVVVERHNAPVVSFHTYADVGSVNEPAGQTGIAHMFEHMAFKGTTSLGTENIEKEMAALNRMDSLYQQLKRARVQPQPDSATITRLQEQFEQAQKEAKSHLSSGEYENILERNGVEGLNAYTSADATGYIYSLPANKLELFFVLESDRFANPVLREFYTERDVVMEERRMRTDSSPVGRLLEEFLTTAFKAHPYGNPTIGHMSDLQNLTREQAKDFFEKYYGPENLTIGIAGDVDPQQVRQLAQKYFGPLEGGEAPLPVTTEEPEQLGERRVVITEQTQPYVLLGYHRPSMKSTDDAVYSILQDVLARGRTSRFHDKLVETEKALGVNVIPSFPGEKYETLFAIFAAPSRGVAPQDLENEIYAELERIKEEGITRDELQRAKTRARSNLIDQLDSNSGLARQFSRAEALTGSWRSVFRDLEEIQNVTRADVQRVAQDAFEQSNRTVAIIQSEESSAPEETAEAE